MNYTKQRTLFIKDKQQNSSLSSLFTSSSKIANNLIARQKYDNDKLTNSGSLLSSNEFSNSNQNDQITHSSKILNQVKALSNKGSNMSINLDLDSNSFCSFKNSNRNKNLFTLNAENILKHQPDNMRKEIVVRNLRHDYLNIESNESTYKILRDKKTEKRAYHLDNLENYDKWRENYFKSLNLKITSKIKDCESVIESTRSDFIVELELPIKTLEKMNLNNIKELKEQLDNAISQRKKIIEESNVLSNNLISEAHWSINHYLSNMKIILQDIGYVLPSDVEIIIGKLLSSYKSDLNLINETIINKYKGLNLLDNNVCNELELNFKIFEKKWKNVKLNKFIGELKINLLSKEIVENDMIYEIVNKLREDQIKFHLNRCEIVKSLNAIAANDLNMKYIENTLKTLDDINTEAQGKYDHHTSEFNRYRNYIYDRTNHYIAEFFNELNTISFSFGESNSDNTLELNEIKIDIIEEIKRIETEYTLPPFKKPLTDPKKKLSKKEEHELKQKEEDYEEDRYNKLKIRDQLISELKSRSETSNVFIDCKSFISFYSVKSLDQLMKNEIDPITNKQSEDRIKFCTEIVNYIDDFDDYNHSLCVKIVNLYLNIAKSNDNFKYLLKTEEMKYQVDIAREEDKDEETNLNKEDNLKLILFEMKESVHKEELDDGLHKCIIILDELEKAYRLFFSQVDSVLNSHEIRLKNIYHIWEKELLEIFGILDVEKLKDIQRRRQYKNEFLQKLTQKKLEEQELKEMNNSQSKIKKIPNKNVTAKSNKKDINANLVDIDEKPILSFKSLMNYDYYIDSSIQEIVQFIIKNIVHSRDDDILNIIPTDFIERLEKEKQDEENPKAKKNKIKQLRKTENQEEYIPENYDIINAYNPFQEFSDKIFNSPLMINKEKALYDQNEFTKDYISDMIEQYKEKILSKLKFDYDQFLSLSIENDNLRRDDYLVDLDIRLKSINPRKGKLQVEEYEIRLTQIEKHKEKFATFEKSILDKNNKDLLDNNLLFKKEINPLFEENLNLFNRLMKSIDEETTLKGINDIMKKYKTEYYEFNSQLEILEDCLKNYSYGNPNNLLLLIEGFIDGMLSFDKAGTYSQREIEYYSSLLKGMADNKIKSQKIEIENANAEKLNFIKDVLEKNTKLIEEKFNKMNDLIMAKNSLGKIYGQPKRIINEYLINMKMKVNQGIEGIEKQFNNIKNIIESSQSDLNKPKGLRENLLSINNCIYYFGKYIEAFKPGFNYTLNRVTTNEEAEIVEIINKEEILQDLKKQEDELKNLGILYNSLVSENTNNDSKIKKEEKNFIIELNSIDEKVKNECQKVYVGEYSKLIANNDKMPLVLYKYLESSKDELLKFRLANIRVLRTISQNLFIISLSIGKCIYNNILNEYSLKLNEYNIAIKSSYLKNKEQSNYVKNTIACKLGSYLANPLYKLILDSFVNQQKERNQKIVKEVCDSQIKLINNIEALSDIFYKKITNLFEAFLYLFDNMIFEEEYIDLGDMDDFKERQDFNFLLKLKDFNKDLNLDSKRSIKKVYIGLDRNKLRINYAEKFSSILNSVLDGVKEKILLLRNEYSKQLLSKSINGYRLDNNSNLIRERDLCFSSYFKIFSQIVSLSFNYYNKELQEEQDYFKSWEIEVNKLKSN